MNTSNRDELAMIFFNATIDRSSIGGMLEVAKVSGAESVAKDIAELSFALADAMIAKSQSGESK